MTRTAQVRRVAAWRNRPNDDLATAVARSEAVRLAGSVASLDTQLRDNRTRIGELVAAVAPSLLEMPGVGPVVAAQAICSWSHPGRVRGEAAFASLAGACPIPASSGNTVRHRLNRGGDRQLNRALHTAVVTRLRCHPETRAYLQRRTAEGRTKKEVIRSLKRYLARKIYRVLNQDAKAATTIETGPTHQNPEAPLPPPGRDEVAA